MHLNILSQKQTELLPFLKKLKKNYYLAGGTAIALHLGHRKSIDFDLFTKSSLNKRKISIEIKKTGLEVQAIFLDIDQQHFIINQVKFTFLYYPYDITPSKFLEDIIYMPSLLDLAAMKAFALSRRSKWKDYVDFYFILKYHFSLDQIIEKKYFPDHVTEKLLRSQLAFHKDIDHSETVDYVINDPPSDKMILDYLIKVATQKF